MPNNELEISTLENWLWEAACTIRGPIDAPKYKDYILPLIFLKRLSDVFDNEVKSLGEEYGNQELAKSLVEKDHSLVRFYLPPNSRWSHIVKITTGLGEAITDAVRAVARENPKLTGVIDITDFNATAAGQRIVPDEQLRELVQVLNQYRLGLQDVEPDILGRAYEYLIRKFAEGQGQSAGEFYTPRMVGILMARILDPKPGMTVYDPACGSSGLLIKTQLRLLEKYGVEKNHRRVLPSDVAPLKVFGQEINPSTFAMSRMNAFIHDIEAEIALGDTMRRPAFLNEEGGLEKFDLVTANPMWNQKFPQEVFVNDPFERFARGYPPSSTADWGWVQHMMDSLEANGRMAVVLDTGSVSRGSGNKGSNREREIRKSFVEGDVITQGDLIEAVILLPENLFYNTTSPGVIIVFNKAKRFPEEIILVNAKNLFIKGRPKNELTEEHVAQINSVYHDWIAKEGLSIIIATTEVARNDFNLSVSRYIRTDEEEPVLPLEEAMVLLEETEEDSIKANEALWNILTQLGFVRD
jgi:type I restriction enzyme M protein